MKHFENHEPLHVASTTRTSSSSSSSSSDDDADYSKDDLLKLWIQAPCMQALTHLLLEGMSSYHGTAETDEIRLAISSLVFEEERKEGNKVFASRKLKKHMQYLRLGPFERDWAVTSQFIQEHPDLLLECEKTCVYLRELFGVPRADSDYDSREYE